MTEFKIDKGIPVPAPGWGQSLKYPFTDMEIGESFFMPDTNSGSAAIRKVSSAAHAYKKDPSRAHLCLNFAVRTVVENGVKGARCWRTK